MQLRPKRTLKVFDLFSGIGGFRAGVAMSKRIRASFSGSCENDKNSVRSYRSMYECESEFHLDDIRSITRMPNEIELSKPLRNKVRSRRIRESLPPFSLLTAGFPCQPHSLMGNRQGVDDDRGSLFYDIAEVIKAVEPEHFVLENVRAIKSVNGGAFYADMLHILTDRLGYNLRVWELNAADYGVPQVRRRLFFVGSRGRLPEVPPPTVSLARAAFPTTWHLLERTVDDKYFLSEQILKTVLKDQHKGYSRKAEINRLVARPLTRTMHKMHRASQDNYFSEGFVNGTFDEKNRTVLLKKIVNERIRRITPVEAFRIQGFSEKYIKRVMLAGVSDTQLYMQTGNAVAPPIVRSVIDHAFGMPE